MVYHSFGKITVFTNILDIVQGFPICFGQITHYRVGWGGNGGQPKFNQCLKLESCLSEFTSMLDRLQGLLPFLKEHMVYQYVGQIAGFHFLAYFGSCIAS